MRNEALSYEAYNKAALRTGRRGGEIGAVGDGEALAAFVKATDEKKRDADESCSVTTRSTIDTAYSSYASAERRGGRSSAETPPPWDDESRRQGGGGGRADEERQNYRYDHHHDRDRDDVRRGDAADAGGWADRTPPSPSLGSTRPFRPPLHTVETTSIREDSPQSGGVAGPSWGGREGNPVVGGLTAAFIRTPPRGPVCGGSPSPLAGECGGDSDEILREEIGFAGGDSPSIWTECTDTFQRLMEAASCGGDGTIVHGGGGRTEEGEVQNFSLEDMRFLQRNTTNWLDDGAVGRVSGVPLLSPNPASLASMVPSARFSPSSPIAGGCGRGPVVDASLLPAKTQCLRATLSPDRRGPAKNDLFGLLSDPHAEPKEVKALINSDVGLLRSMITSTGCTPLHAACDRTFPVRTLGSIGNDRDKGRGGGAGDNAGRPNPSPDHISSSVFSFEDEEEDADRDLEIFLDNLTADIMSHRVLLKVVTYAEVMLCIRTDRRGNLPVHFLARRLIEWEERWKAELERRRGDLSSLTRDNVSRETRLNTLYQTMSQCVEVVLRPIIRPGGSGNGSSSPPPSPGAAEMCRARGSVGTFLPIHIASIFGVSYDILRELLETNPAGARTSCLIKKPGGRGLCRMIPLQLLEGRQKDPLVNDSDSPSNAASGTNVGVRWTNSVLDSGHLADDFVRKSDLLFCFHPDVPTHRGDPSRIRRVAAMVRTEARCWGIGNNGSDGLAQRQAKSADTEYRSHLSSAAESVWRWMMTYRRGGDEANNYSDAVETVVTGLNLTALACLLSVNAAADYDADHGSKKDVPLLEAAHPECAIIVKQCVLEAAKREKKANAEELLRKFWPSYQLSKPQTLLSGEEQTGKKSPVVTSAASRRGPRDAAPTPAWAAPSDATSLSGARGDGIPGSDAAGRSDETDNGAAEEDARTSVEERKMSILKIGRVTAKTWQLRTKESDNNLDTSVGSVPRTRETENDHDKLELGQLCRLVFDVAEDAAPAFFVVLPYRLKLGPDGRTPVLASPRDASRPQGLRRDSWR